jgi:hypothetical protein
MNEEAAAQQYLLDLLEADGTLSGLVNGVWLKSIPQSALMPAVKIDRQDAEDLMVVGLARVWANLSFLVRGVVHWRGGGQPNWTDARAIGDRIDALLHDHEGSNAEVAVHSFREESFTDETLEAGDLFLHVGGIYRVRARAV